ncbi:MAG: hypothetical protein J0H29_20080 [Sphingobacteriales bacterium]|nr:hypothetical protein [Sphingobacteriales bacterium]
MKACVCKPLARLFILSLINSDVFWDVLGVGAAVVKATPPIGVPIAGYYYERGVTGVHI